jgi:hypothetical protein
MEKRFNLPLFYDWIWFSIVWNGHESEWWVDPVPMFIPQKDITFKAWEQQTRIMVCPKSDHKTYQTLFSCLQHHLVGGFNFLKLCFVLQQYWRVSTILVMIGWDGEHIFGLKHIKTISIHQPVIIIYYHCFLLSSKCFQALGGFN